MLAAGLDGIEQNLKCPPPVNDLNIYEMDLDELSKLNIAQLPGSLAEALEELERDEILRDALGEEIYEAFTRAKRAEWDAYRTRVMDWEIQTYLEIA